jgi:hypothetical protein
MEIKEAFKKQESKVIPPGCIRKEFDEYSVFKEINGVKYFIGCKKTLEEAEKLYWEK